MWLTPEPLTEDQKALIARIYAGRGPVIEHLDTTRTQTAEAWVFVGPLQEVLAQYSALPYAILKRVYWVRETRDGITSNVYANSMDFSIVLREKVRRVAARKIRA